jgi:hypothetical protein
MDLREIKCGHEHWINLAQDRDRKQALVNIKFKEYKLIHYNKENKKSNTPRPQKKDNK